MTVGLCSLYVRLFVVYYLLLTLPAFSDERLCNGRVSVRPSVCLSRLSTAAVTCGRLAAELGCVQRIQIDSCRRRAAAVAAGNVML